MLLVVALSTWIACWVPLARAQTESLDYGCDTEGGLQSGLRYVRTVCEQAKESFADPFDPIPTTCQTTPCSRAVLRVATVCGELLSKSAWFDKARTELRTAVAKCSRTAQPDVSPTFVVREENDPANLPITSCSGTLTDGDGEYGNSWHRVATIDAGPGKKVSLKFTMADLGMLDTVTVYDGNQVGTYDRFQLKGKRLPSIALVSGGRYLYIQMVTNQHGVGAGFSAAITCVCADSTSWRDDKGHQCTDFARGGALHEQCDGR